MSVFLTAALAGLSIQEGTEPASVTLNCDIVGESNWEYRGARMPPYEADNSFSGRGSIRVDFANRGVTLNFVIAGDRSDRSGNGLRIEPGAQFIREFVVFDRAQIVICQSDRGCDRIVSYMDSGNEVEAMNASTVIDLEQRTFSFHNWVRVRNSGSRLYQSMRYTGNCAA